VDPSGTGERASVEPCVLGGFLFADLFEAGVGDGLVVAAVVALVPAVPDCSQEARNAMPSRTAIREIMCFFIGYIYFAPRRGSGCLKSNELLGMRARRVPGITACCERLKNFAYATVLLIAFGSPYHSRPNGVHQSLVTEVESRRCSQFDNIL
jgi:hypothetical protein